MALPSRGISLCLSGHSLMPHVKANMEHQLCLWLGGLNPRGTGRVAPATTLDCVSFWQNADSGPCASKGCFEELLT